MITARLHQWAASHPLRPFLVTDEREVGYGEMAALVRAYAAALRAMAVQPGHAVALLCGNRLGFLVAWFALSDIGAITVPLNTGLVGDGLRFTLAQSGAALLLAEPALLDAKREDLAGLTLRVAVLGQDAEQGGNAASEPLALPPGAANSILYTSGTTGLPKGAVLPHGAYRAAGLDMAAALGLTADDRILVFLPLFHANPQMYAVMSALEVGAALVLLPHFSASGFFAAARRHRATGFTYVGTVLSILIKRHDGPVTDHGLRWCVGGGAPAQVWREVEERFGVAVRELYGMTETGGWVSMNVAAASRVGSVGQARPGVTLRVREDGEITARAADPALFFTRYWDNPAATAATLRDGWLHTGDRGWLDADGFLHFAGRLKDLIRRGGEMVAPAEVELQLLKHPAVRECAVVGLPDDILGEEIAAVVVPCAPVAPGELLAFLDGKLPRHMLPRTVRLVDALPKTETEKIKRHEVVRLVTGAADPGR